MSRTFRFVQNDDVLKSFIEFRDTVLNERPIVIARHGDYTLFLKKLSGGMLGISTENTEKNMVVESRTYDIYNTTDALVSRGVRHAIQKMSELSDEDVNRKRLQIWKWYIMDWQKENALKPEEFLDKELEWKEEKSENDLMDMESFLHGEYLNLGNTLALIDKYMRDENYKEMFRKFAINDIMEMTGEDTKDRSLAEAERVRQQDEGKKHTYRFTVTVEATDKEHARQALLNYLAGDERINIQK